MTCIVTLKNAGEIWIGSDLQADDGSLKTELTFPKYFEKSGIFIGISGMYSVFSTLKFQFLPPEIPDGCDDLEYIGRYLVPSMKSFLNEEGVVSKKDNVLEGDFTGLIIMNKCIVETDCRFSVREIKSDYHAVGSGRCYALGYLYATEDSNMEISARLVGALNAAHKFDSGVGSEFSLSNIS